MVSLAPRATDAPHAECKHTPVEGEGWDTTPTASGEQYALAATTWNTEASWGQLIRPSCTLLPPLHWASLPEGSFLRRYNSNMKSLFFRHKNFVPIMFSFLFIFFYSPSLFTFIIILFRHFRFFFFAYTPLRAKRTIVHHNSLIMSFLLSRQMF